MWKFERGIKEAGSSFNGVSFLMFRKWTLGSSNWIRSGLLVSLNLHVFVERIVTAKQPSVIATLSASSCPIFELGHINKKKKLGVFLKKKIMCYIVI